MNKPLSYQPIDHLALAEVLARYDGQLHLHLVRDFETLVAEVAGIEQVVALQSGTSALHLALMALGVGKGDYVIAPSFTYVATINPVLYTGATPVLIDCEADTWNMDPALLGDALQQMAKHTLPKAIIVAHTYGMPAKMNEINALADSYGIPVLEDAAEALGSTYQGKMAGTLAQLGIYSFNNNKIVTTYGGGALLTGNLQVAQRVRFLATQARLPRPYYEHHEPGYNYAMGSLNAAYGLAKLPHLNRQMTWRKASFEAHRKHYPQARFQLQLPGHHSNQWLTGAVFESARHRDEIVAAYHKQGMETRPLWRPMHTQPLFSECAFYGSGVSYELFQTGVCLPVITQ